LDIDGLTPAFDKELWIRDDIKTGLPHILSPHSFSFIIPWSRYNYPVIRKIYCFGFCKNIRIFTWKKHVATLKVLAICQRFLLTLKLMDKRFITTMNNNQLDI